MKTPKIKKKIAKNLWEQDLAEDLDTFLSNTRDWIEQNNDWFMNTLLIIVVAWIVVAILLYIIATFVLKTSDSSVKKEDDTKSKTEDEVKENKNGVCKNESGMFSVPQANAIFPKNMLLINKFTIFT